MRVSDLLEEGLQALHLPVESRLVDQLLSYQHLLLRWNKSTNLTAITEPLKFVTHHLLDALAVHDFLAGKRILDVGSGAGLPGIPLALIKPDKHFILLDSNGKKTRFMMQALIELSLQNVTIVESRVEKYDDRVDHVISRAFSSLEDFSSNCLRLLNKKGTLLAMKGPEYGSEMDALVNSQVRVHAVSVPMLDAVRYLIEIQAS